MLIIFEGASNNAKRLSKPLSGATNCCEPMRAYTMRRLLPTPGSTTATRIESGGNQGAVSASTMAPARIFCAGTVCERSIIVARGLIDRITPFIAPMYRLPVPKSVVSVMIAGGFESTAIWLS